MNLQTPICNTGYGITGYYLAKNLIEQAKKNNHPGLPPEEIVIYPIGNPEMDLYAELESHDWRVSDVYNGGDTLKIWHQHGLHESVICGGIYTGFPIFELNQFTTTEKRSMRHCDRLFVCSHWAKEVVESQLPNPVKVVPLGVDRNIFNEHDNKSRPQTVFFNCGKWEIRKGHDLLALAFNAAFNREDNVELWMMCDNPFIGEAGNADWINRYKRSTLGDKIRFIPRQKTHRDVYNIIRQVDCGVFPARAEGWNLELLECLSCGKNVIATNYAGHTEFINSKNALLLDVAKMTPAQDGIWFFGQGEWAEPDFDQLVSNLRKVHNLKKDGELDINLEGVATAKQFSWANSARTTLSEMGYV